MRIRKSDVSDFVLDRISNKKTAAYGKINELVNTLRPHLEAHFSSGWSNLSMDLSIAKKKYDKWVETHEFESYIQTDPSLKFQQIANVRGRTVDDYMAIIRDHINARSPQLPERFDASIVFEEYTKVLAETKKLQEKIAQYNKLQSDVQGILGGSRSGKQAYDALVSLGFNMAEFKPASENLPALIQLSTDPSILDEED